MTKIIFPIAFFMLLLFSLSTKAQEVKTYTETMDSLLVSVNKKQMKTNILYDLTTTDKFIYNTKNLIFV